MQGQPDDAQSQDSGIHSNAGLACMPRQVQASGLTASKSGIQEPVLAELAEQVWPSLSKCADGKQYWNLSIHADAGLTGHEWADDCCHASVLLQAWLGKLTDDKLSWNLSIYAAARICPLGLGNRGSPRAIPEFKDPCYCWVV